jgi:D-aminopeptidase
MTEDVNALIAALSAQTSAPFIVKDFHRDGYNIIPSLLHKRALLVRGYYFKPLLMYGDLRASNMAFFVGMHAGSGNGEGFLPHTLTSRISRILVNDEPLCETQIFAHVLGEAGMPVTFVSGCPEACAEAKKHLPWVVICHVPKDGPVALNSSSIREELCRSAKQAILLLDAPLYQLDPPFQCKVTFRDEATACRSNRWQFSLKGDTVSFSCNDGASLILSLIKLAYFTPLTFRLLPLLLPPGRMVLGILDRFR